MSRTLSIAARLAGEHPNALLPCPECLSPVRAPKLLTHLRQVHGLEASTSEGREASPSAPLPLIRLRGDARFLRLPLGIAFGLWCLMAIATVLTSPAFEGGRAWVLGVTFVGTFVPLLLALLGVVPAFLELHDTSVRLVGIEGRTWRSVALPCAASIGKLRERLPSAGASADFDAGARDVVVGAFVRLMHGGASLTVGGRKAGPVDRRWSVLGLRKDIPARSWDITLDARSLAIVEYHLADRGVLAARVD